MGDFLVADIKVSFLVSELFVNRNCTLPYGWLLQLKKL